MFSGNTREEVDEHSGSLVLQRKAPAQGVCGCVRVGLCTRMIRVLWRCTRVSAGRWRECMCACACLCTGTSRCACQLCAIWGPLAQATRAATHPCCSQVPLQGGHLHAHHTRQQLLLQPLPGHPKVHHHAVGLNLGKEVRVGGPGLQRSSGAGRHEAPAHPGCSPGEQANVRTCALPPSHLPASLPPSRQPHQTPPLSPAALPYPLMHRSPCPPPLSPR